MSVPDGWRLVTLEEVAEKIMVGIASAATHAYAESGVILIRNLNIKEGYVNKTNLLYIDEKYEAAHRNKRLKVGDVITVRTGYPGVSAVVDKFLDGAQCFTSLITRPDAKHLDSNYLCEYINSPVGKQFILGAEAGGAQKNVNAGSLEKMPITLPPLPEQRQIAAILFQWDNSLSILTKLIEAKRQQKRGLAEQLLTGKLRMNGFEGEWEATKLGDIASMSSGGTPKSNVSEYYGGGIPWVSISDMTKSGKYLSTTDRTLTPLGIKDSAAKVFPEGTILFAMYASIGKCNILGIPAATSQAILGIIPTPKVSPDYIYYFLAGNEEKYSGMGQHGTQKNLNAGMVKDLDISVPPLSEQRAIASLLSTLDEEITTLSTLKAKVQEQKRGLMDLLLTGKVRVKVDELSVAR